MNTIKRYWITKEAMSELCARHGIRPPWEQQEPQPPAAVAPVVALATPKKPRAKPGPKPDPALQQAIEMALKLEREGLKPIPAALTAAEQFQVKFDTVYRRARERRNSQ